MLGSFSPGIRRLRLLPSALGVDVVSAADSSNRKALTGMVGWGLKRNTQRAVTTAAKFQLPYYTLEDGFIRSIGLGVLNTDPFSFIVDCRGIYYDATRPSDLEQLIIECPAPNFKRAEKLIRRIVTEKISKYNHCWQGIDLPESDKPKILLIDQTVGDLSVKYGLARDNSFERMLTHARQTYPDGLLIVKTHPDVIAGKRNGYLTGILPEDVIVLNKDCNPFELLAKVDHVYTVTSQMGFEALLAGKKVSCFGMPFYAGWGLTDDHVSCVRRNVKRSLTDVFAAAYLTYARYVDPITGNPCRLERILDLIKSHKRILTQNKGRIFCFGFRLWKKGFIRRFFNGPSAQLHFVNTVKKARRLGIDSNSRLIVWGTKLNQDVTALAKELNIRVERVEDGFIRSVGLGSDFVQPSSLIIDGRGIYFDPNKPSRLEDLLNKASLGLSERERARRLRRIIVSSGLNKYNNGENGELITFHQVEQTVILVPGQVEDDASIRLGGVDIQTNLALLTEVRRRFPDAYIIYKPHPDVLAGNRKGEVPERILKKLCDQVVLDRNMSVCLEKVQQVHTMTSLAGFEALLRGKTVYTYGLPFYAGWGLTVDRHEIHRRKKKCSLEELIYCSLVLYPRYYHWDFGCFVEVEDMVRCLKKQQRSRTPLISIPYGQRLYRKAAFLIKDFRAVWADA